MTRPMFGTLALCLQLAFAFGKPAVTIAQQVPEIRGQIFNGTGMALGRVGISLDASCQRLSKNCGTWKIDAEVSPDGRSFRIPAFDIGSPKKSDTVYNIKVSLTASGLPDYTTIHDLSSWSWTWNAQKDGMFEAMLRELSGKLANIILFAKPSEMIIDLKDKKGGALLRSLPAEKQLAIRFQRNFQYRASNGTRISTGVSHVFRFTLNAKELRQSNTSVTLPKMLFALSGRPEDFEQPFKMKTHLMVRSGDEFTSNIAGFAQIDGEKSSIEILLSPDVEDQFHSHH